MKQNNQSVQENEHYLQHYQIITSVSAKILTVLLRKNVTYILDALRLSKLTANFLGQLSL